MSGLLTAVILVAAVGQAPQPTTSERLAEHVKNMVMESQAPAGNALNELKELATKENFSSLGFDTFTEVNDAVLGKPLPVILVRLDELREFKEKDDPYKLLHPIPKVMYAVNVKGEARSGVEVEKRGGKWETSSFGLATQARRLAIALQQQAAKDKGRLFFIIKVPALNQTYLSYQTDRGAQLIEVRWDDENAKIEPRPAADVLAGLVKLAKEHDGSFR